VVLPRIKIDKNWYLWRWHFYAMRNYYCSTLVNVSCLYYTCCFCFLYLQSKLPSVSWFMNETISRCRWTNAALGQRPIYLCKITHIYGNNLIFSTLTYELYTIINVVSLLPRTCFIFTCYPLLSSVETANIIYYCIGWAILEQFIILKR
jgi:hypothetical protein